MRRAGVILVEVRDGKEVKVNLAGSRSLDYLHIMSIYKNGPGKCSSLLETQKEKLAKVTSRCARGSYSTNCVVLAHVARVSCWL